jgi:hypothetical protein
MPSYKSKKPKPRRMAFVTQTVFAALLAMMDRRDTVMTAINRRLRKVTAELKALKEASLSELQRDRVLAHVNAGAIE